MSCWMKINNDIRIRQDVKMNNENKKYQDRITDYERERDEERLENERKNREIILNNYKNIDNALSMERVLESKCWEKISDAENKSKQEVRKLFVSLGIAGIIGIVVLAVLFYLVLPIGSFFLSLSLAMAIVFPIYVRGLVSNLKDITKKLFELKEQYKSETKTEIIGMYYRLFVGQDLYKLLGIPNDIVFDSYRSLPKDTKADIYQQYGRYTRYIAPYGTKYHLRYGCSTAFTSVHAFTVKDMEPCKHCASRDNIKLPEWYIYLQKLHPVIKKYPFLFDLSIKPYD